MKREKKKRETKGEKRKKGKKRYYESRNRMKYEGKEENR